jgi:hypothetical protein
MPSSKSTILTHPEGFLVELWRLFDRFTMEEANQIASAIDAPSISTAATYRP